jgi:myosin heavy subunit
MIFDCLQGILFLGNVCFENGEGDAARIVESTRLNLVTASRFFGLDTTALEFALLFRTLDLRGERMNMPMSESAATDARNALCKEIYGRLFCQITAQANLSLSTGATINGTHSGGESENYCIGLLDIFGFEVKY